ncbi:hypothetical protein [Streptomyces sp. NPDC052225]|uniref:hypothetical protein n=1 Tax=Streptomyces sp. NPDC052225 TaxID=3154949 RepID=UPI003439AC43
MSSTKPGAWPVEQPGDLDATAPIDNQGAQYVRYQSEQARAHHVRDSIEQHLREQPSAQAVRAVERIYLTYISQTSDRVIADLKGTETSQ